MTCKVCGRQLPRNGHYWLCYKNIYEPACWRCVSWIKLGLKVPPDRR